MINPQSYEAPSSLWDIVRENSATSEHHELKQLIGADLIDQTLELRKEIELLLELSLDLEEDSKHKDATSAPPSRLPEPPQMRERLAQEIVFFLETIREQARHQTGSDRLDLKRLDVNPEVVDYAYESSSSRPSTGNSRLSLGEIRVTPCSSRSLSRRTARSADAAEGEKCLEVAQMADQLTYMRCDEVRINLRLHLQEEIDQLKLDLELMQDSLASGDTGQLSARECQPAEPPPLSSREPTLTELRTERQKLERALLANTREQPALRPRPTSCHGNGQLLPQLPHSNKAANETIPRPHTGAEAPVRLTSAQRLRSMVRDSRPGLAECQDA